MISGVTKVSYPLCTSKSQYLVIWYLRQCTVGLVFGIVGPAMRGCTPRFGVYCWPFVCGGCMTHNSISGPYVWACTVRCTFVVFCLICLTISGWGQLIWGLSLGRLFHRPHFDSCMVGLQIFRLRSNIWGFLLQALL